MEFHVERLVLLVLCVVFITSVSNCQAPNEEATLRHTGCDYTLKQVKQYFIDGRQPWTLCRPTVPCGFQPHDNEGKPNHPFVDYCSCPKDFECKQHDQSCGYFYYYKCENITEAFLAKLKWVVDNPPDDSTETSKQSIETATPAFESPKDKSKESQPIKPVSEERVVKIPHASVDENEFFDPSTAGEQRSEFVQVSVGEEEDYDYSSEEKPDDFKILGAVRDAVSEELREEPRESSDQSEDGIDTAKLPSLLQTTDEGKEQAAAEVRSEL